MLKRRRFKQLLSLKEDTTAPPRVPFRCSPHRSRRRDARPRHAHPGKDQLARCRQQGDPRGAGADPAARLRHHPTQTGHLINDVSLPLRPRIYRRDGGPPALVPCPALAMTPRCLMEPDCRTLKSAFASSSARPSFAVDLFMAA